MHSWDLFVGSFWCTPSRPSAWGDEMTCGVLLGKINYQAKEFGNVNHNHDVIPHGRIRLQYLVISEKLSKL